MRNINILIFIFTDETNEATDESSSTTSTKQKSQNWAEQVDNQEKEDAESNKDSMSQPNNVPTDTDGQGKRRGRRRNKL